jgi:hypothetical protein
MEYHRQVLQSKLEESKYVSHFQSNQIPSAIHFRRTLANSIDVQRQTNIHLPLRHHHVPLHRKAERLSE